MFRAFRYLTLPQTFEVVVIWWVVRLVFRVNVLTTTGQAPTLRPGKKAKQVTGSGSGSSNSRPAVKKAVFEVSKKKEVGVSDLTLISKISNEAINDNLKKRFENREIYVWGTMVIYSDANMFTRHTLVMCLSLSTHFVT